MRKIVWSHWIAGVSMVSASCIAVFWLYQIFLYTTIEPLSITLWSQDDIWATVYTEERAIEFANEPLPITPSRATSPLTEVATNTPEETVSVEQEIADIARDLLTIESPRADITMRTPTLRTTPAMMAGLSTKSTADSYDELESYSVIIPSYPSMMNLYSKPTKWDSPEIANRSWENMTTKIVSTEKMSIIQEKSENLIGSRAIISATIIYQPLTRIVRDKDTRYYLVPAIDYRLEWEAHVYIPLIRWYR